VANCAAGATYREVGREVAATLLFGVVAPLATLAVLEGRARMRFLSLHTHLEDPQVAFVCCKGLVCICWAKTALRT
jgi:hypothetical protein